MLPAFFILRGKLRLHPLCPFPGAGMGGKPGNAAAAEIVQFVQCCDAGLGVTFQGFHEIHGAVIRFPLVALRAPRQNDLLEQVAQLGIASLAAVLSVAEMASFSALARIAVWMRALACTD